MSTDNSNPEIERGLLVSYERDVKIEEVEGKPIVHLSFPPFMQGHTFAMDLKETSASSEPTGPFRIEYVLGTEFAIHENEAPLCTFEAGYSHLAITPELGRFSVLLSYSDTKAPELAKEAVLVFQGSDGVLQRLVVKTDEEKLSKAVQMSNQIVADLLDALSFSKKVPISIRHIDVYAEGKKFNRRYMTIPYQPRPLTTADIKETRNIPAPLRGAVRLFREGLSSNRPSYRLLCLYRVREVVEKVRTKNDREVLARGGRPDRPHRLLPDNELTQFAFPSFVGKKVSAFLDHVRFEYRLAVAHGNLDEYFSLVLDPANVRVDHRLDFTNAALAPVVAEMIQDEIAFMNRSGRLGSVPQPRDGSTA
jgi:hypothetical protein